MHIRIAYKEHLFDIIEACDINSYKNRELAEIQCKEVQKKMNRVSRDLDLVFFKNKIISRVYKTWNSCQKLPLLHTMISVAEFFFINQRFTIWKQRQRNTRWHKVHPRYFYVYLNRGHMPAKDSLWVDNSLCVDNSKSENLYQTNTYVINPIGLFFL